MSYSSTRENMKKQGVFGKNFIEKSIPGKRQSME
jgi:hypothetical protein